MKQFIIISLLFFLLTACSSKPTTTINFDPDTNFQIFKSYQYSPEIDTSFDANPIMINRIQTAIDRNLAFKGLTKHDFVNKHSADLTIYVSFTKQEKQNNSSLSIGLGTSGIGNHSRSSIGLSTSIPINNKAQTITNIIIDMRNANIPLWYGSDSYEASDDFSIEQKNQAVDTTVNQLLATFPPEKVSFKR